MSTDQTDSILLYNILETLNELKQSKSKLIVDNDSLDVAIDTLITAFNINTNDTSQSLQSYNTTLRRIAAITVQQAQAKIENSNNSSNSTDDLNKKWQDTLSKLQSSNYFGDTTPGSTEYTQRYTKAKTAFETKYNTKINDTATNTSTTNTTTNSTEPRQTVTESDKKQADACKLEGNKSLAAGQYQDAIDMYSAAISLNPYNAIYYCNRAAAYINLKKYQQAIKDCVDSIQYDSKYGKAYYRKGQAELALNQVPDAIESFEHAVKLMPGDTAVQQQLDAARKRLNSTDDDDTYDIDASTAGNSNNSGTPDFSSLLNNPALAGLDMNNLDFASLMNNPAIMQMAAQMMPGMFGGGGATGNSNDSGSSSSSSANSGMPDMSQLMNNPAIQALKNDPEMAPIIADVQANGPSAMSKYMNNPKVMSKLSGLMGGFGQ